MTPPILDREYGNADGRGRYVNLPFRVDDAGYTTSITSSTLNYQYVLF